MKTEKPDMGAVLTVLKDRRKALTKMTKKNQPNRNQVPVKPSEEEIAIYAYMNWEAEGRPEGRDISHWEQAEEQLLARYAYDRLVPFTHVQRGKH
jgi:hypothetical protein